MMRKPPTKEAVTVGVKRDSRESRFSFRERTFRCANRFMQVLQANIVRCNAPMLIVGFHGAPTRMRRTNCEYVRESSDRLDVPGVPGREITNDPTAYRFVRN